MQRLKRVRVAKSRGDRGVFGYAERAKVPRTNPGSRRASIAGVDVTQQVKGACSIAGHRRVGRAQWETGTFRSCVAEISFAS